MKVDLNLRDIELILSLINDSAGDTACEELDLDRTLVYSIEELALIEKLESALRRGELADRELIETGSEGIYH